jgi:hypothetical protein
MSIKMLRHRLLYVKDSLQGTIYTALSNTRWLNLLTPLLAFLIRPMLSTTLSTLALLQAWSFYHTTHKNIDGWFATASSLISALCNNIGAFGGLIARLQGTSFLIAPWFFIAGFGIGALYQMTMAGINARRAYESASDPIARQHYRQATMYNLVTATQLAACASAILLFNFFPPAYGLFVTGFALTVVSVNVGNCIWRSLSSDTKKRIKTNLGFGKPESEPTPALHTPSVQLNPPNTKPVHFKRLFSTCNHRVLISRMDQTDSKGYLLDCIEKKLTLLNHNKPSETHRQKIAVLNRLKQVLVDNKKMPELGKLSQQYPKLIDNFWCEKSDTQQLVEAVAFHHQRDHKDYPVRAHHAMVR